MTVEECLHDTRRVSIHTQNLQYLMAEAYKSLHHLKPEFMWELFLTLLCQAKLACFYYLLQSHVVLAVLSPEFRKLWLKLCLPLAF